MFVDISTFDERIKSKTTKREMYLKIHVQTGEVVTLFSNDGEIHCTTVNVSIRQKKIKKN